MKIAEAEKRKGGPKPALARKNYSKILEQYFQGKLDLPRGTEIASREAGTRDVAEGPAGRGKNGIAKVGMVENIEELGPELESKSFRDLRVFGDREIGVEEIGSGDGIAAQGSRMARARDDRINSKVWRSRNIADRNAAEGAGNRERSIRRGRTVWNCRGTALERTVERLAELRVREVLIRTSRTADGV